MAELDSPECPRRKRRVFTTSYDDKKENLTAALYILFCLLTNGQWDFLSGAGPLGGLIFGKDKGS